MRYSAQLVKYIIIGNRATFIFNVPWNLFLFLNFIIVSSCQYYGCSVAFKLPGDRCHISLHNNMMKCKRFRCYWPFERESRIHRWNPSKWSSNAGFDVPLFSTQTGCWTNGHGHAMTPMWRHCLVANFQIVFIPFPRIEITHVVWDMSQENILKAIANCSEIRPDNMHNRRQRRTKSQNLKCFSSRLAVVFAQSLEAQNEGVVGAAQLHLSNQQCCCLLRFRLYQGFDGRRNLCCI